MKTRKINNYLCAIFFIILNAYTVFAVAKDDITSGRNTAIVQAAKKVGPAVVTIKTSWTVKDQKKANPYHNEPLDQFYHDFFGEMPPQQEFKQESLASGVIISADGYILTNEHVVNSSEQIKVKLSDGSEYEGKLESSDEDSDIALVKINAKNDLPFAVLGASDDLMVGEWVVAIGNPFGFIVDDPKPTVTVGVVSAIGRTIQAGRQFGNMREYTNLIQTDAAINPGNSGGPLVNILGEVIGINTAIFSTSGGSEGIGFAIPINTAKRIKDDLLSHGRVIRPMIGIQLQSLDKKWAQYYNLKEENGVLVAGIIPSSPAEKAGIRKGDIILKLDNIEIKDARDMVEKVQSKRVGDKVVLEVLRDEIKLNVEIVLEEKVTNGKKEAGNNLGIEAEDINPELVKQYRLSDDEGVVITGIKTDSISFNIGLRKGDVIKEINRNKIKTVSDFNKVLEKLNKDTMVSMIVNRRGLMLLVTMDLGAGKDKK
ncbi:MAG: Do family serine endopeptidase [bacterium]|nr:Do family serine endopeptidase [bacterium]